VRHGNALLSILERRAGQRRQRELPGCQASRELALILGLMRPLPERAPDVDRRWVTRVPPDPHVRFETNDYSLDPRLVGRRVEVRASQREISAVCLDTGELAARHERSFAKNRTITALEPARALRERRGQSEPQFEVEQRPLAVYDALIA
jgi:Mu transposase, C-terminal domain